MTVSDDGAPAGDGACDRAHGHAAVLQAAFEAVSQGIVVHGRDGLIIACNPAAERILGLTLEEMTGRRATDPRWKSIRADGSPFIGEDHPATVALMTGRAVHDVTMGVHRADGTLAWIWINAEPIAEPNEAAVVASFSDVTELVTVEAALHESEHRYRVLAENAADVIVSTGSDGLIDWVSPSVRAALGWDESQLLSRRLRELIHPDDVASLLAQVSESTSGGARTGGGEARFARADGGWCWMSGVGRALLDEKGQVVGGVDTLRDISDRVAAQAALRASESQFRLLAENSSDVVVRISGSTISWVSPSVEQMLGAPPSAWTGTSIVDVVHPADLPAVVQGLRDTAPGAVGAARLRLRATDGTHHWIDSHFRTFIDDSGRPDGVIASMRVADAEVWALTALQHRARHDDLTGLLTRAEVIDRLSAMLADDRRSRSDVAVAFCDIDDFKAVNDEYGHGAGDEVLRVLSARIASVVRDGDHVARFGGDEILVVLSGVRDLEEALAIADKLRAQSLIPIPIPVSGECLAVTLSVGVTLAQPGEDIDALIDRADDAMYDAKARGKDRVVGVAPVHDGRPDAIPMPRTPSAQADADVAPRGVSGTDD